MKRYCFHTGQDRVEPIRMSCDCVIVIPHTKYTRISIAVKMPACLID